MILGNTQFGKTLDIAWRELSTIAYRQEIIANNIANQNTPNFKRSAVNFETKLKEALDSQKHTPVIRAVKTNPKHMNFFDPIDYRTVDPRRSLDWQTQSNNNGNNVDIESEMNDARKWKQLYQLINKTIADGFKRIDIVLGS